MIFRLARILLDPQGGEGNGEGNGTTARASDSQSDHDKAVDFAKMADALAKRHGTADSALMHLLNENHSARDKNREKDAAIKDREGRISQLEDELKKLTAYRELGELPELRKSLGERDQYKAEADGFRKAELIAKVAKVSGFKPSVLGTLADGLEIVIAEEKGKDGKAIEVARVKGEGDQTTLLTEYAEKHWPDFLPALKADQEKARPIGTPINARPTGRPDAGTARADDRPRPVRNIL